MTGIVKYGQKRVKGRGGDIFILSGREWAGTGDEVKIGVGVRFGGGLQVGFTVEERKFCDPDVEGFLGCLGCIYCVTENVHVNV